MKIQLNTWYQNLDNKDKFYILIDDYYHNKNAIYVDIKYFKIKYINWKYGWETDVDIVKDENLINKLNSIKENIVFK